MQFLNYRVKLRIVRRGGGLIQSFAKHTCKIASKRKIEGKQTCSGYLINYLKYLQITRLHFKENI